MRRRAFLIAAVTALACFPIAPARASGYIGKCTAQSGGITFSPSLPKASNPLKVATVVTMVGTLDHCDLPVGVTSGRVRFVSDCVQVGAGTCGTSGSNCTTFRRGDEAFEGKVVWTWNTGATWKGSLNLIIYYSPSISPGRYRAIRETGVAGAGGLGGLFGGPLNTLWPTDGSCRAKGLAKLTYKGSVTFANPGF